MSDPGHSRLYSTLSAFNIISNYHSHLLPLTDSFNSEHVQYTSWFSMLPCQVLPLSIAFLSTSLTVTCFLPLLFCIYIIPSIMFIKSVNWISPIFPVFLFDFLLCVSVQWSWLYIETCAQVQYLGHLDMWLNTSWVSIKWTKLFYHQYSKV